jgi:hypothetical protein
MLGAMRSGTRCCVIDPRPEDKLMIRGSEDFFSKGKNASMVAATETTFIERIPPNDSRSEPLAYAMAALLTSTVTIGSILISLLVDDKVASEL